MYYGSQPLTPQKGGGSGKNMRVLIYFVIGWLVLSKIFSLGGTFPIFCLCEVVRGKFILM